MNLPGSFVVGAGECEVYTFVKIELQVFAFFAHEAAEIGIVSARHVRKARAEAFVIRPAERIRTLQVNVVTESDERSFGIAQIDAACSVGKNGGFDAHAGEDPHGKSDLPGGVAFVKMNAALHAGD